MKTYFVLYFVNGADLGTQHAWIPTEAEATFEADRHEVDERGLLTLYVEDEPVQVFNPRNWVYFKIDGHASIEYENPHAVVQVGSTPPHEGMPTP